MLKMFKIFINIFIFISFVNKINSETVNNDKCSGFQAKFDPKKVVGTWKVVAIIPEKSFPENQSVSCYKVDFSETDVGGLKWLINNTLDTTPKSEMVNKIRGLIIRQRYHSKQPFDVWSQAVEGVSGCFEQVLALDGSSNKKDLDEALTHNDKMQLHLLDNVEGMKGAKPLLLQMLWGKLITVVIYSRNQDITLDQVTVVKNLIENLRGPQQDMKFCDQLVSDRLIMKPF